MNTKQLPALLAPSRQVPWALSPELCAPRWGSQHSPPPSTGLHAHGNLESRGIRDVEPPVMGGTSPSPSSSPAVCPLSSPLTVPRLLQAPASLLSCLERCRNCIKIQSEVGAPGTPASAHPALLGLMCRSWGGGGCRLLCLPCAGSAVGLFFASPAPWEHPRQTPTPAAQNHPQQTHGVPLPPPVCRAGSPAERCPERGAALGETEAGGVGGTGPAPGRAPLGGGRGGWGGGWVKFL